MINGQILLIIHKGGLMLKNKSIDYIFGMITGASLMVAFWANPVPVQIVD